MTRDADAAACEISTGKTSFVRLLWHSCESKRTACVSSAFVIRGPDGHAIDSKENKKEKPMKNDTRSKALTTTCALEPEHPQPSGSNQAGIGSELSMLMEEVGDRPLIDELAIFANAIWV